MSGQTLGAKIRAARKRRAWSQAQLAGKIGVGDWEIGRWEKDQVIPKAEHQSSLQVLLGLRQEDFLVEKRGKRKQRLPTSSLPHYLILSIQIDLRGVWMSSVIRDGVNHGGFLLTKRKYIR